MPTDAVWRMQIVQESNALKSQARDEDEADPFARLHPGRRLFLPSVAQEESESAKGKRHRFLRSEKRNALMRRSELLQTA